jgi:hypothetical protein
MEISVNLGGAKEQPLFIEGFYTKVNPVTLFRLIWRLPKKLISDFFNLFLMRSFIFPYYRMEEPQTFIFTVKWTNAQICLLINASYFVD